METGDSSIHNTGLWEGSVRTGGQKRVVPFPELRPGQDIGRLP